MNHGMNRCRVKTPSILRPVSDAGKASIRLLTSFRLNYFPLNNLQAEWWAGFIRRWPGIFGGHSFSKWKTVEPGVTMHLGIIDVIERNLLTKGTWETAVGEVLKHALKPGDSFLDIGANIGYFSLKASNIVGKHGRELACEPSIRALAKLVPHVYRNPNRNIMLLSAGAGESSSVQTIHWATETNIGATTLRKTTGSAVGKEQVLVLQLGRVLDDLDYRPDVIKIDVEGYEFSVLKGISVLLEATFPVVICELSSAFFADMGHSVGDVIAYMRSMGYFCYMIEDNAILKGRYISSEDAFPDYSLDVVFVKDKPTFLPLHTKV